MPSMPAHLFLGRQRFPKLPYVLICRSKCELQKELERGRYFIDAFIQRYGSS